MASKERELSDRVSLARAAMDELTSLVPRDRFRDPPEELSKEDRAKAYDLALRVAELVLDDLWSLEAIGEGSAIYALPDETREFLALIPNMQEELAVLCVSLEPESEPGLGGTGAVRHCRPTRDLARELVRSHPARNYTAVALEWDLFQPDEWWSNAYSFGLRPILVGKHVPKQIHRRLEEIHRCVLTGNWFAAVALARSTLEAALRDVCGDPRGKLQGLIRVAEAQLGPELHQLARNIQSWGNQSLHPSTDDDLFLQKPDWARDRVKVVVDGLTRIVETLYANRSEAGGAPTRALGRA